MARFTQALSAHGHLPKWYEVRIEWALIGICADLTKIPKLDTPHETPTDIIACTTHSFMLNVPGPFPGRLLYSSFASYSRTRNCNIPIPIPALFQSQYGNEVTRPQTRSQRGREHVAMEEEWVGAEALGEAVGGVKDHDKLSEEVSDPISVSGFKEKCLREVYRKFSCDPLLGASREELAASMGLDEEQFTQVEETFRASDLMVSPVCG